MWKTYWLGSLHLGRATFPAYVKEHFHEVRKSDPSLKPTVVLKKLSEMYKVAPVTELSKLKSTITVNPKTDEEKNEAKKKLTFARRRGLPKPPPLTGYRLFLHDQLAGLKGTALMAMTSKLSEASKSWKNLPEEKKESYNLQASENKLAHMRSLRDWAVDNGIQYSKRSSVLASRLYSKYQRSSPTTPTPKKTASL